MKFVRYGAQGAEKPGMLDSAGVLRDLSGKVEDIAGDVLGNLSALAVLDPETLPQVSGAPRLGPCVGGVGKFICIGLNYADHAKESGKPLPSEPLIFAKYTSAMCGPNDPLIIPRGSVKTDWEVELAVVIGRKAKYVAESEALDYVAGFCAVNDVSERSYQLEREGQWSKRQELGQFRPDGTVAGDAG